jgi:hypothetical protein
MTSTRTRNLAITNPITEDDHDGVNWCADCTTRFDDPSHGSVRRCTRKTAHVCAEVTR